MGDPTPPSNPYTYSGQANSIYGNTLNQNYGLAQQGNQFTQNITNNPYAGGYQQAAGNAANLYGQLSPLASGAASSLYGAGNTALGAGNQILQAGFDPQKQLYSQVQNQNSQQNLAQLANMGVAGTPYGAGVAGQENTNFNLDWQNNLLSREATAANAFSGLNQTAQSDYAAGGQQGQLGAQSALMQGQLPYATSTGINQTALDALRGQQGLVGNAQSGAANYLQSGFNAAQTTYQDQYQQNQDFWNGIGSIAGDALGEFGGLGAFGQLGAFSGVGQYLSGLFGGGTDIWAAGRPA